MVNTIELSNEKETLEQALEKLIGGLRKDTAREIFVKIIESLRSYFEENPEKGLAFLEKSKCLITSLRVKLNKNLQLDGDEIDYFNNVLDLDRNHYQEGVMLEEFVKKFVEAPKREIAYKEQIIIKQKVSDIIIDIPAGLEAFILMNTNLVSGIVTQETEEGFNAEILEELDRQVILFVADKFADKEVISGENLREIVKQYINIKDVPGKIFPSFLINHVFRKVEEQIQVI